MSAFLTRTDSKAHSIKVSCVLDPANSSLTLGDLRALVKKAEGMSESAPIQAYVMGTSALRIVVQESRPL